MQVPREGAQRPKAGPAPNSAHTWGLFLCCATDTYMPVIITYAFFLQPESSKYKAKNPWCPLLLPVCLSSVFSNNDQVQKSWGQMGFPGGP